MFLVFIVHNSQRLCQYYYTLQKKETHKGILGILNQNCSVTLLDIDSNKFIIEKLTVHTSEDK